jgi:hypothetical protein
VVLGFQKNPSNCPMYRASGDVSCLSRSMPEVRSDVFMCEQTWIDERGERNNILEMELDKECLQWPKSTPCCLRIEKLETHTRGRESH